MRSDPAITTSRAPAAAAMSSIAASGADPDQPRNEISTDPVFCRMKIASSTSRTAKATTANQMPLVADPRNGSGRRVVVGAALVVASVVLVVPLPGVVPVLPLTEGSVL